MRSVFPRIVEAIHQKLRDHSIEFVIGEAELAVQSDRRRVVWVKEGGTLRSPTRGTFVHPSDPKLVVRPLFTNALRVVAYLSAEGDGELETVWADVLSATLLTLGTASLPTDFTFPDEAGAGVSRRAEFARMTQLFEWQLLISQIAPKQTGPMVFGSPTVTVLGFDTSYDLTPLEALP